MNKRSIAVTAAVVALLSSCSNDGSNATGTDSSTSSLSLKTVTPYSLGNSLSGLRVTGTGFQSVESFTLNNEELHIDALDDTSALLFYRTLPDTGYQMLRAEAALASDSLPVIYRDSIVTFAGTTISWKGELAAAPTSPELNWAYFNTTTKTAYIFDGTNWSTLAVSGTDGVNGTDGKDGTNGVDGKDGVNGTNGLNGLDGISIIWLGELAVHPETPAVNNAYYNTTDGISYIFNGTGWTVLAKDGKAGKDGIDGISIVWLGQFDAAPATPTINNAYYNTTDGTSYIFDGTAWNILAKSGIDGTNGTNGTDGKDGVDGKDGTNGTDGVDGKDGINGIDGVDGISIVWKGELMEDPVSPEINWAYYNTLKKASFIFDGTNWSILAKDGKDGVDGKDADGAGEDGVSIIWKGANDKHPATPELNWAYYNTTEGASYIFNGTSWNIITKDGLNGVDGKDGISIVWLGELATAPATPSLNNAYYNTTEGISYIFNGTDWDILAKNGVNGTDGVDGTNGTNGKDGIDGKDGVDGVSLIWKGELATAPTNPQLNWAYFNTTDERSYIFNGTDWDTFAKGGSGSGVDGKDGKDGISIVWKGELSVAPTTPELNWAYHNTTDGNSYIWDGAAWNMLAKGGIAGTDGKDGTNGTNGTNGVDGVSLIWKGSHATAPTDPQLNWGYFNTTDYVSYIYSGSQWDTLAVSEKPVNLRISAYGVSPGDTLILEHNLNTYNLTFNGQYKVDGNMLNYDSYQSPGLFGMKTVHTVPFDYEKYPQPFPSISYDDHLVWTGYRTNTNVVPQIHTLKFYRSQVNTPYQLDSLTLTRREGESYGKFLSYDGVYHPETEDFTYLYTWEDDYSKHGLYMGVASFDYTSQILATGDKVLNACDGQITAFKMANKKICILAHGYDERYVLIVDPAVPKPTGGRKHVVEYSDTISIAGYNLRGSGKDHLFDLPDGNILVIPYQANYSMIINPDNGSVTTHETPVQPYDALQLQDGRYLAFQYTSNGTEIYSTQDGITWNRENLVSKYTSKSTRFNRYVQLPDENIIEIEQNGDDLESTVTFHLYDKYMNHQRKLSTDETMTNMYAPLVDRSGTIHLFGKAIYSYDFHHKELEYGVSPESGLALRMLDANRVGLINNTNEDLDLYLAVNRGRSAN